MVVAEKERCLLVSQIESIAEPTGDVGINKQNVGESRNTLDNPSDVPVQP